MINSDNPSPTPPPILMKETIQLDLTGEQHFDFEEDSFTYTKSGYSRIRLPSRLKGRVVTTNSPIYYADIQWIGAIITRQNWLLFPGLLFTLSGPIWVMQYFGNWMALTVFMVWSIVLGIFPMLLWANGRTFLGIATGDKIVVLPMDRKKKKIARILGLLNQACPPSLILWQLDGTIFNNPDSWNNNLPTGKGFDRRKFTFLGALISLFGIAGSLLRISGLEIVGIILFAIAAAIALIWVVRIFVQKWRR